jgi:hypothetical protein
MDDEHVLALNKDYTNSRDTRVGTIGEGRATSSATVRRLCAQMITKECFGCGNVTAHQHLHDCADGIAETHMVGSERFVCELCGHVTWAGSGGAERFPFTFDKVRSRE